ncbi:glycosyltransferase [Vibrio cyclitrophicus]|uniref:glycosyltransferase n=1 Tax=Vibrio cyclitrophicus TaxID=47951 RepID=UPI0002EEB792|nr:glycosyltransferase [Vibrio cyclitrophicus]OED68568.1 hypothetical protein OAU_12235 [Vibrio cyclitrophicus ZF99]OED75960.1 hypothetical protein OAS_00875 [Vibrio cyclitrophicus ZF65]PME20572.1 hypothetical protein BCV43_08625 [Vibrio cyclitrophicus]PME42058.1 hypothetical protein BCV36_15575 [Vibrio cyclitrophicus]PME48163.1 hypothetical protein BCV37_23890 [Vibrio cyclitrophicus]
MGRILIITVRAKGGGAEKIIDSIVKLDPFKYQWINMESFLNENFIYRYIKLMWIILKNINNFDKIVIGSEGPLGIFISPFKLFYRKKIILWNHCYFEDYKRFLSKKNQLLYRLSYLLYPLRINASPASKNGQFIANPYVFSDREVSNTFLDKEFTILLSVSSLAKLKSVDLTIKLLSKLPSNIELNIYGDGIERKALENLVDETLVRDRTRFFGFVNEPFCQHPDDARILIINSQTEALPTIILESIEHGIPIIVKSYNGSDYWSSYQSVFILEEITPEKVLEIINYFKCLSHIEYSDLFHSDIKNLSELHSYDNFIRRLAEF